MTTGKPDTTALKPAATLEERLAALLRSFPERRVVVVGDLVADQFL